LASTHLQTPRKRRPSVGILEWPHAGITAVERNDTDCNSRTQWWREVKTSDP